MRGWVGLVLLLPLAGATDPYVIVLDWREGHSLVGTTPLVMSPVAARFAFEVEECHPRLVVDLLYEPAEIVVEHEDAGSVALGYDFLVEAWRGDALVAQARVLHSGYGTPIGVAPEPGEHELRVALATGLDVSWVIRLRAGLDPACVPSA